MAQKCNMKQFIDIFSRNGNFDAEEIDIPSLAACLNRISNEKITANELFNMFTTYFGYSSEYGNCLWTELIITFSPEVICCIIDNFREEGPYFVRKLLKLLLYTEECTRETEMCHLGENTYSLGQMFWKILKKCWEIYDLEILKIVCGKILDIRNTHFLMYISCYLYNDYNNDQIDLHEKKTDIVLWNSYIALLMIK